MAESRDDWFEAQYNVRAAVPAHAEIHAGFEARSQRARLRRTCFLDVAYGPGQLQQLDIFPTPGASRAVVSFIHGGYWRSRDKSDYSFLAESFCRAGFTLVVPNYSLCPQASIEQIVREMLQAHAWIYRHIAAYGGPPQRLIVCGHSAGGHLAAMMAACDWHRYEPDLPADLVKAVLAISGLYDLMPLRRTSMNESLALDENAAQLLSPVLYRPSRSVPVTAAVGAQETTEFQRQAKLLARYWPQCPCEILEVAETNHYSILEQLADSQGVLFEALEGLASGLDAPP